MRSIVEACLIGSALIAVAVPQDTKIPLTRGVSVQMPVAAHAVEVRAADEPAAVVVAVTADGKLYVGVNRASAESLSDVRNETVYLKADARAPYQEVLAALDALRGKTVVLLAASPAGAAKQGYVPPYGVKCVVAR